METEKKYFVTVSGMYFKYTEKGKRFFGKSQWEATLFTLKAAKKVATQIKGKIHFLDDENNEIKYLFH